MISEAFDDDDDADNDGDDDDDDNDDDNDNNDDDVKRDPYPFIASNRNVIGVRYLTYFVLTGMLISP